MNRQVRYPINESHKLLQIYLEKIKHNCFFFIYSSYKNKLSERKKIIYIFTGNLSINTGNHHNIRCVLLLDYFKSIISGYFRVYAVILR